MITTISCNNRIVGQINDIQTTTREMPVDIPTTQTTDEYATFFDISFQRDADWWVESIHYDYGDPDCVEITQLEMVEVPMISLTQENDGIGEIPAIGSTNDIR